MQRSLEDVPVREKLVLWRSRPPEGAQDAFTLLLLNNVFISLLQKEPLLNKQHFHVHKTWCS